MEIGVVSTFRGAFVSEIQKCCLRLFVVVIIIYKIICAATNDILKCISQTE